MWLVMVGCDLMNLPLINPINCLSCDLSDITITHAPQVKTGRMQDGLQKLVSNWSYFLFFTFKCRLTCKTTSQGTRWESQDPLGKGIVGPRGEFRWVPMQPEGIGSLIKIRCAAVIWPERWESPEPNSLQNTGTLDLLPTHSIVSVAGSKP